MTLIVDEDYLQDSSVDNWIQDYYNKLFSGEITPKLEEASPQLRRKTINITRRLQTVQGNYQFLVLIQMPISNRNCLSL